MLVLRKLMHHMTEKFGSWFFVSLSSLTTTFCFVFLVRNRSSKQMKENAVVLLCSISSLTYTVFYALYDVNYSINKSSQLSGYICYVMPIVYKSTIATSKCFCSLIFAYRYKTVNRRISVFSAKKAHWFSVGIITITVLQFMFDKVFFWLVVPKDFDCFSKPLKFGNCIYMVSMGLMYLLVAVFQTIILCEIIKPIFKHCTRLNRSILSSNSLRSTFYRIVLSSLVFTLSDFSTLVTLFMRVLLYNQRSPIIVVINLNINTICLICSYSNYKERLFPFLCCLGTAENDRNRRQINHNCFVNKQTVMRSQIRSKLKTIDNKTVEDEVQMRETIVIHPNIQLKIPVCSKTINR